MNEFSFEKIKPLRDELKVHPIYNTVKNEVQLRLFMEHHVFSVWDFMSLLKFLQRAIAPTTVPWKPNFNPLVQRFINDIVLEEETDLDYGQEGISFEKQRFCSHFELYCKAMREIKASTNTVETFSDSAADHGFDLALKNIHVNKPAAEFMKTTFGFVNSNKPHVVAAAFALGREHIIPLMFRELLNQISITKEQAPAFYYYLERHIDLDGDHHGPLSLLMLNELCEGSEKKLAEAEGAACEAIKARIKFWDDVHEVLKAIDYSE